MRHTMLSLLVVLVLAAYGTAAPPQFTSVGDSLTDSLNEDSQYAVTLTADDPDTETVTFSLLAPVPAGMTIDSATGAVGWTPTNDEVGDNIVTAAVTDSAGEADTVTWTLTVVNVNDAPVLEASTPAQADFYLLTGTDREFGVTVTDVDAGDVITYAFAVDGVVQGAPGAVDTFVLNLGAESTAVVSFTATDGSADTLTGSWTVRYVDAYPDSLVPAVTGVRYLSNGTHDRTDDVIEVVFSRDIDDGTVPASAAAAFALLGDGDLVGATLGTGETADDNALRISIAADDTVPAISGDMLVLAADVLLGTDMVPAAADTAEVTSYHVMNVSTGTSYMTIRAAVDEVNTGDTVVVVKGTYTDSVALPTMTLTAADPKVERPLLKYDGRHYSLAAWQGSQAFISIQQNARPVVSGFEIDGTAADGSTKVNQAIYASGMSVYDCIVHDASTLVREGNTIGCELYNGSSNGIYSRSGNVVISDNYIHDCGTAIYQYRGDNKQITGNVITANTSAFYLRECEYVAFENNLVYRNGTVMNLYTGYPSYGLIYRNNTITMNGGNGLTVHGAWGVTVENNIIAHNGQDDTTTYTDLACLNTPGAGEAVTNNVIGTANANAAALLAMAQSTGNKDADGSLFADPENDDFHLGILSEATDASDDFSGLEDYDGSQADLGCYGGPNALDTEMPAVLDTAYVVRVDTVDTLFWAESADDDFGMYVIIRASMDSGGVSTGEGELVDTIGTRTTNTLAVPNGGGKWFYAIQAVDTTGYGGGFNFVVSTASGEVIVTPDDVVNFGLLEIDSFAYEMVAVLNVGTEDLTVSDVRLRQGAYAAVADTNGDDLVLPLVIPAGAGYPVVLITQPDDYVTISDTLEIVSDDPDAADTLITLLVVGEVAKPEIRVPASVLDYGTLDEDSTSDRERFYIHNDGTGEMTVDSMWYADGTDFYSSDNLTTVRTVSPGGSFRLTTYCRPTRGGTLLDTLYVGSNDPVTPVAAIPMTAVGVSGITDFTAGTVNGVAMAVAGNPVAGRLGLVFTIAGSKRLTVDVFDADGAAVHRLADGTFSGTVELTARRGLAAGTYFVMVRSDDERMIRKVVVE